MNFGSVLIGLRGGHIMRRPGWPESMYLTLQGEVMYLVSHAARTVWTPEQVDILASDWEIA